jgi:1-phosphatidylinositol-3-phosphate 5-kinase
MYSKLHLDHLTKLVHQLLQSRGLSQKWADTILTVTQKISRVVRPDVRNDNDDMDIRQYVTIKTVRSSPMYHVVSAY